MKVAIILVAALFLLLGQGGAVDRLATVHGGPIKAPHQPVPPHKRMLVTIPRLGITRIPTFDAPASHEGALTNGLMHVRGTGFPWQRRANVYLAGHDLGWPGTRSWHVFWNLRDMRKGDTVRITDTDGTKYTYRVYKKFRIAPDKTWVTRPRRKSIVTLQTCVPHWTWTHRLIVRAELVKVSR